MVTRIISTARACGAIGVAACVLLSGCTECPQVPGLNASQCKTLSSLILPEALPKAVGNARADDERAALLGFQLFFDARLSRGQNVRCATCHVPERAFADGRATSKGLEVVDRNSPSIYTAAWQRWQMWDGRVDSLWSQPLLAFENAKEMDFTRLELAHQLAVSWRNQYEDVFGALPPLDDGVRFPARGKPGDAAFDSMTRADQLEVNRVAANAGKAIEAYERRAALRKGRFDRFLAGDDSALSVREREGFAAFFKAKCDGCHPGPTLSDDDFHVINVPPAPGKQPERGRAAGVELLATTVFSVSGPFHEGAPVPAAPTTGVEGAFHTPSLRNVARTGPWGHNGTFDSLEAVVDFHLSGGEGVVDEKLVAASLSPQERTALLAFLRALDASDPPSPWNNWPDR